MVVFVGAVVVVFVGVVVVGATIVVVTATVGVVTATFVTTRCGAVVVEVVTATFVFLLFVVFLLFFVIVVFEVVELLLTVFPVLVDPVPVELVDSPNGRSSCAARKGLLEGLK